jgi:hypothetical protein
MGALDTLTVPCSTSYSIVLPLPREGTPYISDVVKLSDVAPAAFSISPYWSRLFAIHVWHSLSQPGVGALFIDDRAAAITRQQLGNATEEADTCTYNPKAVVAAD